MKKYFSRERFSQVATAWMIFFALVGKPLCSLAAPSLVPGMGSIPYTVIWTNGANGGNGFAPWQLSPTSGGSNVFFYIGSSTLNDNSSAPSNGSNDINTAGVAWGITALDGVLANARRPFTNALASGQSFQIDMDNGYINTGGSVGISLENSSSNAVWQYYFQGGASSYTINAGSTNGSAMPNFTVDGMHITFTLTSASTYSATVLTYTPGGGPGAGTTYTYTGSLLNPSGGQSITSVRLWNYQAGSGTNYNAYFNNLSISGGAASDNASTAGYAATGTTFRVWAGNATAVYVQGSWNNYSKTATPLYSESNQNWSADVPGVTNGDQYLYYISNSSVPTNMSKLDPRAREVTSVSGYSVVYNTTNFNWAGDNYFAPGLSNAVIYEMDISNFNDPAAPSAPGTFYTATNLFPHLQQLGVNVLEVMPVNEFGCCYSWGYNPADIFAVDYDAYGGPDAFKTFVKAAHQFGMAVFLDVCHNHYGGTDPQTYGDLIYSLWRFDGTGTTQGGTNFGGIYFYGPPGCLGYAQSWGPRPDYGTSQVSQFIEDNIAMWLSEYHVDGFRWDSVGEIEGDYPCTDNDNYAAGYSLISNVSGMIHSQQGNKINIAEDDPHSQYGYNGFDAQWDNNYFFTLVQANLTASSDSSRNMGSISTAVNIGNNGYNSSPGGWANVVFTEDHDQCGGGFVGANRMPVQINSADPTGYYARKRSTLGAAIVLSAEGTPMLLSGQEILITNVFSATTPLNWSWTNTYSGILSFYTDMIGLRRNLYGRSPGLTTTNTGTIWEDTSNQIIAYQRGNPNVASNCVVVICNFANTYWPTYNIGPTGGNLGFPVSGTWYVQLNSDWTKYSPDYANYGNSATINVSGGTGTISIAPYSVLVLSQYLFPPPPTPQGLAIASVTTNQIGLTWNVSSAATGYIVNRNGSPIATTSTNAYTDTGLSVGVQYCYSVSATNIAGVSANSATNCATTLPATSATNLLAWWTFDEGTGSFAYDSSGNGNTGTVVIGNGYWDSGMISNCLYFYGYNGDELPQETQVTVSNSASLNPVNGITLAAWVYDQSGFWANTPRIIEKGASDNQYALFVNSSGSLEFLLAGVTNITVSPPSSGFWHHLAATYDGSSLMSLYIDGQLATQQVASGGVPVVTDSLAIGNKPGSSSLLNFFTGDIDDVRIYGSALTPSAISALYNTDSVGDGIPNWWRLQFFNSSSTTNNTSCATCDADGTGQDNYFKFVADLSPLDSTYFTVQIATSNQWINLTFWPAYPNSNLTYTALSSTDLVNYSAITNSGLTVSGITNIITDFNPSPSIEFYRIQITNPTAPSN
jgi:1,4-alpha-glucan branching enzyme